MPTQAQNATKEEKASAPSKTSQQLPPTASNGSSSSTNPSSTASSKPSEPKPSKPTQKEAASTHSDEYRSVLREDEASVKRAEQFRTIGNQKVGEKKYSDAEAAYTMGLSQSSTDPLLYSNRAMARLAQKNFAGALEDTTYCLSMSRENVKALHRRAQALLSLGSKDLIKGPLAYVTADRILQLSTCDAALRTTVNDWKKSCLDTLASHQPKEAHDQFLAAQTTSDVQLVSFFREPLQAARDAYKGGQFVHALSIYDQILHLRPNHREALLESANVMAKASHPALALSQLVNLLILHTHNKDQLYSICILMADCYFALKQYHLAYAMSAQALFAFGGKNALGSQSKEDQILTSRAYMAKALRLAGDSASARAISVANLQVFEDHTLSLDEYGRSLEELKQPLEALRVYLKMFVLNMHNPDLKERFASVMQNKEAFAFFREQMDAAVLPEQFYSFIASGVKEFGAVQLSSDLYRACLEFKPNHPTFVLNLVHNLEVQNEHQEAYALLKEHVWHQRNSHVGPLHMAAIWNIIKEIDVLDDHQIWKKSATGANSTSTSSTGAQSSTDPNGSSTGRSKTNPKAAKDTSTASLILAKLPKTLLEVVPGDKNAPKYGQRELDLLATIFTIVKICYIKGVLDILPEICKLTETACEGRDIHDTVIKNENAYYSCIGGLMEYHAQTIANPPPEDIPRIYVAGDSHSMTPAWHKMILRGKEHLVHPLLVTGMKIWHLRPASRFFPKNNFYNVVPKAPPRSTIIFLFGEIDCREGFLVSVQKARYKDLDEAAQFTIDIYMDILKSLVEQYQYEIFVHPIVPVLDATRHVVIPFMNLLVKTIEKRKKESAPGDWTHNIHMLDFFWKLVKEHKKGEPMPEYWGAPPKVPWFFEKTYDLDLTHMNPKYLPLLQDALTVAAKEADSDPHPFKHVP